MIFQAPNQTYDVKKLPKVDKSAFLELFRSTNELINRTGHRESYISAFLGHMFHGKKMHVIT